MDTDTPTGEAAAPPAESEAQPTWDNALSSAFEVKEEPEAASETVEDPAAPVPAKETTETPTEEELTPTVEEEPEEEPTLEEITASDSLPPLSRKKLAEIKKTVLDPLRDPSTPIADAWIALHQFHPTRAQELAQSIVNDSATNHPNDWLSAITGVEGLTVEGVKEALSIAAQPRQEPKDDSTDITEYLSSLYGEDWKDAQNDSLLVDEDAKLAKLARKTLDLESRVASGQTEFQGKLDSTQKELEDLRRMANEFKTKQDQEAQAAIEKTFNESVTTYRSEIEQRSLPKLFTDLGLEPTEQDTDNVKGVKSAVKSYFEPVYGQPSDFELFIQHGFESRNKIEQIAGRVSANLSQAATLQAQGQKVDADKLIEQAKMEQNALVVLTRKAAQDFLATPRVKAQMGLLEEIATLRRQMGGRPEIIGSTIAAGDSDLWREENKKKGGWDTGLIGERLSMAR